MLIAKSRKSVRFHDEVNVQVVDVVSPVDVIEINEVDFFNVY